MLVFMVSPNPAPATGEKLHAGARRTAAGRGNLPLLLVSLFTLTRGASHGAANVSTNNFAR